MKDNIVKILKILTWIAIIGYTIFLYQQWATIVKLEFIGLNTLVYILEIIFAIFIISTALRTIKLKKLKWIQFFIGIVLISFSYFLLQDDSSKYIFIKDLTIVLGVFIAIAAPTWFLISKEVEKKLEDDVTEIIEV